MAPLAIRNTFACGLALLGCGLMARSAEAAPRIDNLSLRGLQAGGIVTLAIDGADLLPEAKVMLDLPNVKTTIRDGATANHLEVEFAIDGQAVPGIYPLRVASAAGLSPPVAIAVDHLSQTVFAPQVAALNVALTGSLNGATVLTTAFHGKKDQTVVVDVESRRLGANLNPVLHVYDARRVQLAWSQATASIAGDARLSVKLPADGTYTIELHDALFRGGNPGFFRLKIGEFHYADTTYPLAVQQGTSASLKFLNGNLPDDAVAAATWPGVGTIPARPQPAPWPANVPLLSGSRPNVIVTSMPELLETPAGDKPQELSAAPVAINGRLENKKAEDRYRLAVTPGQSLRIDVLARRAGSPLDGVLSVRNEQGAELAGSDDRPGTTDPGLDFKVPDNVSAIVLALRDLEGRGGQDFVYRIAITPIGTPDFSLSLAQDTVLIPKDGAALLRVTAQRNGYNGPIALSAQLPNSASVTLNEIPAGANEALVTLSGPGLPPAQTITTLLGKSVAADAADKQPILERIGLVPANTVNTHQPWLREQLGMAITTPAPLFVTWSNLFTGESRLVQGTTLPNTVRVYRAGGVTGPVRLKLLTTQATPRKTVKVNNQDRQVDDVDRTLRLEAVPTVAADQSDAAVNIIVPADLAMIPYDVAFEAELLTADGKGVVASVVTPARRMEVAPPIKLAVTSEGAVQARAGVGPTGSVAGKISRAQGFTHPVSITLTGLPKGVTAPTIVVPGDKDTFDLAISFPYGTPAGDLAGVKLAASSQIDPKNPNLIVRAAEVPLALAVVPGDKPPLEKPLTIFEDQPEFVANLKEGGGQVSLNSEEKYSGTASVKVTPDQRYNPALPGLGVKIREKPGPGEFRFLQFAWKKQGGQSICLQLNHDGQWGPTGNNPAKFRYHAGPAGEVFGGSVGIDNPLPAGFTLVTRDLFADFGEFTLNGIALTPVDGEFALFDHLYLGTTAEDFELVKP